MSLRESEALAGLPLVKDPVESAKIVGLRYVHDDAPGYKRVKSGAGFRYLDLRGRNVRDSAELERIKKLVIPPAWTNVWICPHANGHLQATGRDARGRKQHRYHPRWREVRDETKYARMIAFAKALPKIRRVTKADLKLPGLPRRKVLATIVKLLEVTLIRVGNDEYARENHSYGLTTMKVRHAKVNGNKVHFHFRGKSGKEHNIDVEDKHLARIVKSCQDLPGQDLFEYIDENGELQDVKSEDVNDYLREITGADFTAKDFRTWSGTVLAAMALQEFERFNSQKQARTNIVQAIENVARRLGNTPAVCRKCYVHPAVLDAYLDGSLLDTVQQRAETEMRQRLSRLRPEEGFVLGLLQQRLAAEKSGSLLRKTLQKSLKLAKQKGLKPGGKS
ncbi:MAG TPA: DNA topoisomerase IB [Verrucomicrobiae bacterium]